MGKYGPEKTPPYLDTFHAVVISKTQSKPVKTY